MVNAMENDPFSLVYVSKPQVTVIRVILFTIFKTMNQLSLISSIEKFIVIYWNSMKQEIGYRLLAWLLACDQC